MRPLLFLFVVLLAVSSLASPLPERAERQEIEFNRPPRTPQFVKGQKGTRVPSPLNLRKGEYICGNKICSLKTGQIPPHCEGGICQYKV